MLYSIQLKKDLRGKGFKMKKLIAIALVTMALGTSAMAYSQSWNPAGDGYQQTWNPAGNGYVNTWNPAS